jgi:hypothetical protein
MENKSSKLLFSKQANFSLNICSLFLFCIFLVKLCGYCLLTFCRSITSNETAWAVFWDARTYRTDELNLRMNASLKATLKPLSCLNLTKRVLLTLTPSCLSFLPQSGIKSDQLGYSSLLQWGTIKTKTQWYFQRWLFREKNVRI